MPPSFVRKFQRKKAETLSKINIKDIAQAAIKEGTPIFMCFKIEEPLGYNLQYRE